MRKRDNSIVENVDFTRLSEILRKKHIKWSKLSRKYGEFFKRLAMASLNEHTSIENFIFDCIWKSVN